MFFPFCFAENIKNLDKFKIKYLINLKGEWQNLKLCI